MLQDYTAFASFLLTHNPVFREKVVSYWLNIAAYHEKEGRHVMAERCFEKALKLDEPDEK